MHHAPAGPPLSARLFAALDRWMLRLGAWVAVVGRGASIVRRSRIVPVTLASFLLGGLALIVPALSDAAGRPGSVALSSTSREPTGGLFSATGDGWTPHGASEAAPSSRHAAGTTAGTTASTPETSPAGSADAPATDAGRSSPAGSTPGTTTGSSRPPAAGPDQDPGSENPGNGTSGSGTSGSESTGTPTSPVVPSEPSADPDDPDDPDDPVEAVLGLVNDARSAEGCDALAADTGLAADATAHSSAMRDLGFVGLASPDSAYVLDLTGRSAAVVADVSEPAAVVFGWLTSDSAAVLGCGLTSAGVGAVDGHWTLLTA